ncbi:hypothetical protein [Puia dinghuensis]|uniref:Carboxypeptidase regulatory-like domain-containing protein n=1 Tax=Puia dinghuensis TaxID=1792502 RepID=A0A8J2XU02_9BACT|nr:hypothetical protein [Puia dinghuensis]GGB21668.1 hypothetical protein GCM10011511_51860 [Puia dinghuensis]
MKKLLSALTVTILTASLIGFIACNKDSSASNTTSGSNDIPPDITVTASLQGRVVDENGVPVQGAAVTSGTVSTTTDINGLFNFSNISLSSRFGYVQVVKSGYFTGSRSIITNSGASNYVTIQLTPRTATATFPAASGGTISVQPGDSAAFTANSIVSAATNAAYTGTVHVFATYLDPTAADLYKHMPGDLRGIGSDGKETALQSFGMLRVELEDDAGNKLQIASGQKATLTWAIPATLQSSAPATIPLWYFNDSTGRWIQQGSATRQGNNYVGTVSHFSWWNCDAPIGTVVFKLHVKDQYGNPIPHTYVEFTSSTMGTRGGYTDANGFAQGLILKGQALVMKVVTECGNVMGGINVGPALQDQDLGTVTINVNPVDLTLTGTVVDCSNNPVDSGMVNVTIDGLDYRAAVTKGAFTLPIVRCYATAANIPVTPTDFIGQQTGSTTTINAGSGQVKVGQLSACGITNTQFVTVTVNNATYNWTTPTPPNTITYQVSTGSIGTTPATFEQILASDNSTHRLSLNLTNLSGTGQYSAYMTLNAPNTNYAYGNPVTCNVTSFGAVGSFITGTLSGNLKDTITNTSYPLTGSLKVQRTQ